MALVDSNYRFRVIQVGDLGRTSNGGVYAGSALGRGMAGNTLNVITHHVMVGDAAFTLKPYLLRPYPGWSLTHQKRIFNYRLARARMVVENRDVTVWDFTVRHGDCVSTVYHSIPR